MFFESNTSQGENNMISTVADHLNKIKNIKSSLFKHNILGELVDNSQKIILSEGDYSDSSTSIYNESCKNDKHILIKTVSVSLWVLLLGKKSS
jgi:hypothetical protein